MPIGWAPRRADVAQAPATLASMWEDVGRVHATLYSVFMREPAGTSRECVGPPTGDIHYPACIACVQRNALPALRALLDPSAKRCFGV